MSLGLAVFGMCLITPNLYSALINTNQENWHEQKPHLFMFFGMVTQYNCDVPH